MTKLHHLLADTGTGYQRAGVPGEMVRDVYKIPVDAIDPDPENARTHFDPDELQALADDIKRHGQIQNAVVFPNANRYTLVAGERRLRACKLAGINTLVCWVLPRNLAIEAREEMAFAENMARSDLRPTEVAARWKKLMDRWGVTGSELARRIGVAQSTVSKKLALLKLDAGTQAAIDAGQVGEEHARRHANATRGGRRARGGRANRNVLELSTGTVKLKRGRTWDELLAELQVVLAARRGDTDTAAAA
jgi:ParB/RepB/Spo0J family partition protein